MMHEHEVFISSDRVCCTCGFTIKRKYYIDVLEDAIRHALENRESCIIKPLANH